MLDSAILIDFERQLCAAYLKRSNGRCWPVSDLWFEGADWLVGGSCPLVADRPKPAGH